MTPRPGSERGGAVVEFALVVDVHVKQGDTLEEQRPLVDWARRIDLGEQEAAIELTEQVLSALREVF